MSWPVCENCGRRVVLPWRHALPPAYYDVSHWTYVCTAAEPRED